MDTRKNNPPEPWDNGVYGTGNTQPPKSDGGIIALLLIVVISLSGIASALGILNIRLFNQLNAQNELTSVPMSFSDDDCAARENYGPEDLLGQSAETVPGSDVSIELNRTPDSFDNIPQEGGLSWQEIYAKNIPSVVSISCSGDDASASGTGVVLTDNGYLVTNCHLVEDMEEILVRLTDDRVFTARLIGADPVSDLAVLYIPATDLTPAEFGNSGALRVGDAVAAIGDPLGTQLRGSMTDGIVSAINRDITVAGRTMTLIQTNAALNPGNSGGPLINCYGQVVGINTMKINAFSESQGVEGLGFAIPSTTVKEIVDQLIANGYVAGRPTLGLEGEEITSFYQHYYRMPPGLYIVEVDEDSTAAAIGLQPGDILLSLDDCPIQTMDDLNQVVYAHEVGDCLSAVIYRGGKEYSLSLTLDEAR